MSKLLILFAVTSALVQAEELAAAMRKAGHRVLVRDADTWLVFKDAPERADMVMVPPGGAYDPLHEAYALSAVDCTVIRDEPGEALLASAREAVAELAADRDEQSQAELVGDQVDGDGSGESLPPAAPEQAPTVEAPAAVPEQAAEQSAEAGEAPAAPAEQSQAEHAASAAKTTRRGAK